jgi:hypothetical protein
MTSGDADKFTTRIAKPTGKRPEWTVTVANGKACTTTVLDVRKPDARDKALVAIGEKFQEFATSGVRADHLMEELEKAAASWHEHKPESRAKSEPALPFDEVEPAGSEVDLSALLDDLCSTIIRFLVLPEGAAETVALWICHTWCLDGGIDITPRLVVSSPVMRCGKTTLLDAVRGASRRTIAAENTTSAPLFRAIEEWQPTIVLDEADNLLVGKDADKELHGILNAGYRRGGAVMRCVGEDHLPTRFDVFASVAFGLIGKLPGPLMDRSIVIQMRRRTATEHVERVRPSALLKTFEAFRPRLARWSKDNCEAVGGAQPALPDEIGDRAQDIWEPLLAIADLAGGCWGNLARAAAVALSGGSPEDDTAGLMLLVDIRSVFESKAVDRITTKDLLGSLIEMEERPWSTWSRGRELTARQLGRLLDSFAIKSKDIRQPDARNLKGYELGDFADAFKRYAPE